MHPPTTSRRAYILTALALWALTAATYAVAQVDLGPANTPIALSIAVAKAALIVLVFMHARHAGPLTKLVIVVGIAWLLGLILGILDDYVTRSWLTGGP